jgi:hypothetical protein
MIIDDCNLYPAAKKTYSVFNGKWMEAGIYIGLKIIMIFISGLILGSIIFALSIPMGFFGAVVTFSSGFIPKMHPGSLIMVLAGAVAMMFISLLLLVPVVTFFRYYSLLVLRTLHPRYDLLPEHEVYR